MGGILHFELTLKSLNFYEFIFPNNIRRLKSLRDIVQAPPDFRAVVLQARPAQLP